MNRHHLRAIASPRVGDAGRDRGTALLLVLVLIVVGSLIVLPLMQYSMTVMRANTALSDKSKRVEAVKAGLRVSLADPVHLYEACGAGGPATPVQLAPTTATNIGVTTRCYFIDYQTAQADTELRYGLTATRRGATPPAELSGSSYVPVDPASTNEWWSATTSTSQTDKIWLPNLPTHGLNRRSSSGTSMPAGFPTCKVFFPGTYPDPMVLDGPTYFASGIYYFQSEVKIASGASVVVGLGAVPGCTTDQEAIFYAQSVPGTHYMNGLGGTWVFGGRGRLTVSNADGTTPVSLQFNTRYVAEGDDGAAPSAGVSIMSVNGELAPDGVTGVDLNAPGVIEVPVSYVGTAAPALATAQDYLPSVFTPKPVKPDVPTSVTAQKYVGAAKVTWVAPFDGGSPITGYVVTASTGQSCATAGALTCVVTGLSNVPITFTVVARNAVGDSAPSVASAAITPGGTTLTTPAQPARPTAVPYKLAARVSWTAPADGGAPIRSYTVTASPGGATCSLDTTVATVPPLRCDITGLDPLTPYTFTVTAINAIGGSPVSAASATPIVPAVALADLPTTPPPVATPYDPTPIVGFDLPTTGAATVSIPGYVAIPQGRLLVNNPRGFDVTIAGGVLAGQFTVTDGRNTGPQTVDIGFLESVVQRKFRIVSTSSAGPETSTAVVQVNQNGAYAVNSWEVQ